MTALEEQCKHELVRAWCGDCNGTVAAHIKEHEEEMARVLALPGWFKARYGGRCGNHPNEYFQVGSPITRKRSGALNRPTPVPVYLGMCCAPTEDE